MVDGLIARRVGNLEELRRLLDLATQDPEVDASLRSFLKEEAGYTLYLQSIIIPVLYQCQPSSERPSEATSMQSSIGMIFEIADLR